MENKYTLEMSEDCGNNYNLIMTSENLKHFERLTKEYETKGLRWAIKDSNHNIIDCCSIHKSMLNAMGLKDNSQEPKQCGLGEQNTSRFTTAIPLKDDITGDKTPNTFIQRYRLHKEECIRNLIYDDNEIFRLFELKEKESHHF